MEFMEISNSLAPIRMLRQAGRISDDELVEFLASEREFKQLEAARGTRWIEVIDCRAFEGLSPRQRLICIQWLATNLRACAKVSIGVAFAVPRQLEGRARLITSQLERRGLPTIVTEDLDEALRWALERCYDEGAITNPASSGVFRPNAD